MKEVITSYWDSAATSYDQQWGHGIRSAEEEQAWRKLLIELVGDAPRKVVDVGTGTGFLALLLAELGHSVVGVDLSKGMLAEAEKKARKRELNARFVEGDAENLPIESESVDVVISRHLFWTLVNPEKAVSEWMRVLKSGGKVIIIDSNWYPKGLWEKTRYFIGQILKALIEKRPVAFWGRIYGKEAREKLPYFGGATRAEVEDVLKRSGFSEVKSRYLFEVDEAERRNAPYYVRIGRFYKRYAVEGIKQ